MAVVNAALAGAGAEPAPPPMLDPEISYIWRWWNELSEARSSGFGANPISFTEIASWSRLVDEPIMPWEVRAIRAVDNEYLASQAEEPAAGEA